MISLRMEMQKMSKDKHTCKDGEMPKDYKVLQEYRGGWVARDHTFKWMDKLTHCPFCGEKLE